MPPAPTPSRRRARCWSFITRRRARLVASTPEHFVPSRVWLSSVKSLGEGMVTLDAITRRYQVGRQTVEALAGVSLDIPDGQFVAIVGPSGSGKSTLLNILGCLDSPSSGSYCLDGTDVSTFDDELASDFRNRRIGFVFQSLHLMPRLIVLENVLLPRRFLRTPAAGLESRAHALL